MYNKKQNRHQPRKNHFIRTEEIQLITSQGENLGVKKTSEALRMAEDENLDLVEINPNQTPPICKIIDYSKYIYEKKKKQKKSKAKDQKELRFSPVIEQHDIDVRIKKAEKFLNKGHNVKLTIFRKGRQTHEQAREVMNKLLDIFQEYSTIEDRPKQEGRKLYITIKAEKIAKKKDYEEKEESKDKVEHHIEEGKKEKIMQKIKEKRETKEKS